MIRQMLKGNDGGVSLSKLLAFLGFVVPLAMWVCIGVGIAFAGWQWSDWSGWFIGGGSMAGGGIAAHGLQRATWKPPSDY